MSSQANDRDAIRECIYRTARAIDRCDEALFWSAYWPDAVHTGVGVTMPIADFIPRAASSLRNYETVSHMIGNVLIKLAGDRAVAESYVQGYHRYEDNGRKRDNIQSGRYLDRLEQRSGEWKILERTVLIDWFRDYDDSGDWSIGPMGGPALQGSRHPEDPSYALFAELD